MPDSRKEPSLRLRLGASAAVLAVLLVGLGAAAPAQADDLQLTRQALEVSVVQGASANFSIPVAATGDMDCARTIAVSVPTLYPVSADGAGLPSAPATVQLTPGQKLADDEDCAITWPGAPAPDPVTATATATADTPPGNYTVPIVFTLDQSPEAHDASDACILAGAAKQPPLGGDDCPALLTIHVLAAAEEQPAQVLLPARIASGPKLGQSVELSLVSGEVTYKAPGRRRSTLGDPVIVPNGTVVDARDGHVKVTVERDATGALDDAEAWGGRFRVFQNAAGTTTLTLSGGGKSPAANAARATKRPKLWVTGKGNFRTRGKRASAIVRGTTWLTEETSGGTAVVVQEGAVAVRDFTTRRTVLVRAGHSYLARNLARLQRPRFTG